MTKQTSDASRTLERLSEISRNLWWSWNPEAVELLCRLEPESFARSGNNPLMALRHTKGEVLEDSEFRAEVEDLYDRFRREVTADPDPSAPRVSYFCMEYGIHESLPLYSGGLGILAGDHLKAASDLGIPFTAVGLFLREGYFRQHFDRSGRQHMRHEPLEVDEAPLEPVTTGSGDLLKVSVRIGENDIQLKAWKANVGRATLYLLDSDVEDNPAGFRTLTHRLYQGGVHVRIQKEIVLGVGGVRLLRALGIETDVYHMNEGHCAFLTLELLRERLEAGDSREVAEDWVRSRSVFTTHTPVPAGHDRFGNELFTGNLGSYADALSMSVPELMAYGRIHPEDREEPFNMTVLGMKMARHRNGVSRLHGEVTRLMWRELWPESAVQEVPVGHITNGVHLQTWTSKPASDFIESHLGDWKARQLDPEFWSRIRRVPDAELWEHRCRLRARFVEFVNARVGGQSLPQVSRLDPDALTIGFARRFATYKRAPLIFSDLEQARRLFAHEDRPVQIVFAGKAHPADEGGKGFIQRIYEVSQHEDFRGRVIFLEDYDIELGRELVAGCDVWLNNPRRPMEASGTSGQKVTLHGGLNAAILDGWWPEGYNGSNGWAIGADGSVESMTPMEQDEEDARNLYSTFRDAIIPTFYDRDADEIPVRWVQRMKEAIATLPPVFGTRRMVRDYLEEVYRT